MWSRVIRPSHAGLKTYQGQNPGKTKPSRRPSWYERTLPVFLFYQAWVSYDGLFHHWGSSPLWPPDFRPIVTCALAPARGTGRVEPMLGEMSGYWDTGHHSCLAACNSSCQDAGPSNEATWSVSGQWLATDAVPALVMSDLPLVQSRGSLWVNFFRQLPHPSFNPAPHSEKRLYLL